MGGKMDFKGKLNKAYRKYWNAHNRAENALDEITLLIQTQYPNLEASVTSEEIIFIEKDNPCNEYYGFDDIEARYELNK